MSAKVQSIKLEEWKKIPCECGRSAAVARIKYKEYWVRGWKCEKCKREYIHPEDSLRISNLERLKQGLTVTVGQLGASYIIRIPKEVVEIYKLRKGETVVIQPETLVKIGIRVDD